MRPLSSFAPTDATTRYHFAYEGGCFDVDVPSRWTLNRNPKATRFNATETPDIKKITWSVGMNRWDLKPGVSLRDAVVEKMEKHSTSGQKRAARKEEEYGTGDLSEGMEFKAGDLKPATIGAAPQTREALSYLESYNRMEESLKSIGLDTRTDELTWYKVMHQMYFLIDGSSVIRIVFNSPEEQWAAYEPTLATIRNSVRFGNCAPDAKFLANDKAATTRCEAGHIESCLHLGFTKKLELATQKEALTYFAKACDLKSTEGCMEAGSTAEICLEKPRLALTYFTKACDLNDASGCSRVGFAILKAKQDDDALKFLGKACEMKDPSSCLALGDLYSGKIGSGKNADPAKAKANYDLGCKLGEQKSCEALKGQ